MPVPVEVAVAAMLGLGITDGHTLVDILAVTVAVTVALALVLTDSGGDGVPDGEGKAAPDGVRVGVLVAEGDAEGSIVEPTLLHRPVAWL
jgi:hypothetical protein